MNVEQFVDQVRQDPDLGYIQIRGQKYRSVPGARELRTQKNDYWAVAWDTLGNVTILDRRGYVKQLYRSEYQGA